jgi:outer membrane usher protein FimD/PapC
MQPSDRSTSTQSTKIQHNCAMGNRSSRSSVSANVDSSDASSDKHVTHKMNIPWENPLCNKHFANYQPAMFL